MSSDETWGNVQSAGEKLYEKYEEDGNLAHLSDAISTFRRAFDIRPPGHAEGCDSLRWLGPALSERYEQQGDLEDLTDLVACYQEALRLCPIGDPMRPSFLDSLSAALKSRYERQGDLNDLADAITHNREALQLCPIRGPFRQVYLNNLISGLEMRYEREGTLEDLTDAIACHREALQLLPIGRPGRFSTLNSLAIALTSRYEQQGDLGDLAQAIAYLREAFQLRPDHFTSLNNLATAFEIRYERQGDLDDLTNAITYHREALHLCPVGHPDRSMSVSNLANGLQTLYEREGSLKDLNEAIGYHREALQLRPVGDAEHPTSLNNLANALLTRYGLEGDLDDLSNAIIYRREALQFCPMGHPHRFISLNNLSTVLHLRFEREGNLDDLTDAIAYLREALPLCPLGHPQHSTYLDSLAAVLWKRYEREGDLQDLSNAIDSLREALSLSTPGHPGRPRSLNTLALALCARHKRIGDPEDLANAIAHHQEALDLRPIGHPDRSTSLNNLASTLRTRYEREGTLKDLSDAIAYHREALDLRPVGHPDRSISLQDLAGALYVRLSRQNDLQDHPPDGAAHDSNSPLSLGQSDWSAGSIVALLREASQIDNCSPRDRLSAALEWIRISMDVDPSSTLEAYTSALHQLDLALALAQSLTKRHSRLLTDALVAATQDLGVKAATWAIQRGDLESAVELLEQGRSLLLAQVGRYRVELDDLRQVNPEMADRFTKLSHRLDTSVVSNQDLGEINSEVNDQYERYRKASTEWNLTVDQIRALPGFDMFLKPPSYEHLRKAAVDGPVVILIPGKTSSEALIVREHAPIHHLNLPLAGFNRLTKLSSDFTFAVAADDDSNVNAEGMCVASLRSLWSAVVGPIAHALQDDLGVPVGSRVWWCPTSTASFLPLHAAGMFTSKYPKESFPNIYVSSYTSTLQALIRSRERANINGPKKLLIVSQPETPGEPPLLAATEEVTAIMNVLGSTQDVTTLSGEAGTCEAVQRAMEYHSWIHFACHGVQSQGHPLESYLSLYDGHLTLNKIIERNLPNADLAFLSACHSAAGDHDLANEVLHLAAAMQFSGFRGVVGTLWAMADDDGPPLAEVFYREMNRWEDSRGAAMALNEGIKHLRRKKVPINRWMRFVHIGI